MRKSSRFFPAVCEPLLLKLACALGLKYACLIGTGEMPPENVDLTKSGPTSLSNPANSKKYWPVAASVKRAEFVHSHKICCKYVLTH